MCDTEVCPEYRLRLFLSVDLVGSTAFKANAGAGLGNDTSPRWVYELRAFYREFPKLLADRFENVTRGEKSADDIDYPVPRIWKTVGDEIIFCNRVLDLEHLSFAIKAFMMTLEQYGDQLSASTGLDVKGSAWTAAFPSPNVTVEIVDKDALNSRELPDENFEKAADDCPNKFDFLGKEMDSGFRITKNANYDKLAISASAGYLLSQAVCDNLLSARFVSR